MSGSRFAERIALQSMLFVFALHIGVTPALAATALGFPSSSIGSKWFFFFMKTKSIVGYFLPLLSRISSCAF